MGKFWKEIVGGQVQQGVYLAGPRHASKQYGSFKTGRPPRLPFQFVVYFEVNPQVYAFVNDQGTQTPDISKDFYNYSSLVRAVDIPSVDFTVEKKNQYNKLKPIVTTKDFKPFTLTVYDDIESRWYALWQNYYNYYFMDGRFDVGDEVAAVRSKKAQKDDKGNDIAGTAIDAVKGKGNEVANRNNKNNTGVDLVANNYTINTETSPFNSDRNGMDIHNIGRKNFFNAIHVFQIHADTVTRTTAINPILTSAQVTQLDYASTGVPSEITFNIEYEKLAYGPILNYNYDNEDKMVELDWLAEQGLKFFHH